jgi:uncharacterized membrane protein
MDRQMIGLIFAFVGVGATLIYVVLGLMGINVLKDMRDRLDNGNEH